MATFKNPDGIEIETEDPATINDYRHREGWEEVNGETKKKASKKAE